jgi:hypothetical protein
MSSTLLALSCCCLLALACAGALPGGLAPPMPGIPPPPFAFGPPPPFGFGPPPPHFGPLPPPPMNVPDFLAEVSENANREGVQLFMENDRAGKSKEKLKMALETWAEKNGIRVGFFH